MHNHHDEEHSHFNPYFFAWTNLLTLAVLAGATKLLLPGIWQAQLDSSLLTMIACFFGLHFMFAFVEFFFHRYVLHAKVISFLSHFYVQHTLHHSHTDVEIRQSKYSNEYPIMQNHQLEASFFPWFTFILFAIAITPVLLVASFLTSLPFLVTGYITMLFSIVLYEYFHLLFHYPLSWWEEKFTHNVTGNLYKRIYAFHLDHHLNPGCNESVSGFFGIPIPDLLFGTYVYSGNLYPNEESASSETHKKPAPIWPIRMLDKLCGDETAVAKI